ncbi:double homeobox protein 4-like protein 2 [Equus przewalskii]|uniref:Double homeobox protein 4-like protein 2 n=1 Tax=Equus przewalskii TaxID=9798 RepID=A0ABM4JXS7_EQUPR
MSLGIWVDMAGRPREAPPDLLEPRGLGEPERLHEGRAPSQQVTDARHSPRGGPAATLARGRRVLGRPRLRGASSRRTRRFPPRLPGPGRGRHPEEEQPGPPAAGGGAARPGALSTRAPLGTCDRDDAAGSAGQEGTVKTGTATGSVTRASKGLEEPEPEVAGGVETERETQTERQRRTERGRDGRADGVGTRRPAAANPPDRERVRAARTPALVLTGSRNFSGNKEPETTGGAARPAHAPSGGSSRLLCAGPGREAVASPASAHAPSDGSSRLSGAGAGREAAASPASAHAPSGGSSCLLCAGPEQELAASPASAHAPSNGSSLLSVAGPGPEAAASPEAPRSGRCCGPSREQRGERGRGRRHPGAQAGLSGRVLGSGRPEGVDTRRVREYTRGCRHFGTSLENSAASEEGPGPRALPPSSLSSSAVPRQEAPRGLHLAHRADPEPRPHRGHLARPKRPVWWFKHHPPAEPPTAASPLLPPESRIPLPAGHHPRTSTWPRASTAMTVCA